MSRIAEKLIDAIEQPVKLGNKSVVVSASVGITMIPGDGQDVATILSNADMAMYEAKRAGKRSFSFYDQALQATALARLQLEEDIAMALEQKQFVLHYQPIIRLSNRELDGFEALIRWQHPERGLLFPDQFIGVAEETGKITQIGYWVIKEACRQIRANASGRPYRLAINLSPRQFKDPHLLQKIQHIVRSTRIDARSRSVTRTCAFS